MRTLRQIAIEISADWQKVNYGAKPYLEAMMQLNSVTDSYGYDSGKTVVLYFLSNASTYRGETAKQLKNELKTLLKCK